MGIKQNIKNLLWKTRNKLRSTKYFENKSSEIPKKLPAPPIVLAYHHFSQDKNDNKYNVSVKSFEKQIKHLIKSGYTFIWQNEYENRNEKSVIISVDDGWMDNYLYLFPIIKKYNIKVTINLTAKFNLCDSPQESHFSIKEIKEMLESGLVSFDSHSMTHPHLTECTDDELDYEIIQSQKLINETLGIKTDIFVCPFEDANEKVINKIKQYYRMAYNYAENCDPKFSVRRVYVYEHTKAKDIAVSTYYHYLYFYRKNS